MKEAAAVVGLAEMLAEKSRAKILLLLLDGRAYTATEIAKAVGVTNQTISFHLAKLVGKNLIVALHQGRHKYFRMYSVSTAELLETMLVVSQAEMQSSKKIFTGPEDLELRQARVCYNHLAGEMGVKIFERLLGKKALLLNHENLQLTKKGRTMFAAIDIDAVGKTFSCKACLDWSERKYHLAGELGAALLAQILAKKWARRLAGRRTIVFSAMGQKALEDWSI